jgi:hypothetical protein
MTVAAASNDAVILRNLRFDGLLGNGTNAANANIDGLIFISGGMLVIEHCNISVSPPLASVSRSPMPPTRRSTIRQLPIRATAAIVVTATVGTVGIVENVHAWYKKFRIAVSSGNTILERWVAGFRSAKHLFSQHATPLPEDLKRRDTRPLPVDTALALRE